ncbi:YopX family protein [Thermodesulfobacteriota bacterium]
MEGKKYRAWHWNKKRMYQVDHIDSSQQEITCWQPGGDEKETLVFPMDCCKLQQFTGFQDMYGEDIYEDDIVDDTCGRIGIPQSTHIVQWDKKDAEFYLHDYRGTIIPLKPHLSRVIGNKYKDRDILDRN